MKKYTRITFNENSTKNNHYKKEYNLNLVKLQSKEIEKEKAVVKTDDVDYIAILVIGSIVLLGILVTVPIILFMLKNMKYFI